MSLSSQNMDQEDLPLNSCYFTCYEDKETGSVFFKCGWGQDVSDIENFAFMLSQINSGQFEESILEEIKSQCGENGNDDLIIFSDFYHSLSLDLKKSKLVVEPSEVDFK